MSDYEQSNPEDVAEKASSCIDIFKGSDGEDYPVTPAMCLGRQIRRLAVELLRIVDPEKYEQYRKMKYTDPATGQPTDNPTLATRREAYRFAMNSVLDATYSIPGF